MFQLGLNRQREPLQSQFRSDKVRPGWSRAYEAAPIIHNLWNGPRTDITSAREAIGRDYKDRGEHILRSPTLSEAWHSKISLWQDYRGSTLSLRPLFVLWTQRGNFKIVTCALEVVLESVGDRSQVISGLTSSLIWSLGLPITHLHNISAVFNCWSLVNNFGLQREKKSFGTVLKFSSDVLDVFEFELPRSNDKSTKEFLKPTL